MTEFIRDFFVRLLKKLGSIAPVAVAAAVVFGMVWLVLIVAIPFLPERWQDVYSLLNEGDWKQASDRIRATLESTGLAIEIGFIALQAFQVIVAPIPGQLAGLLGGYLFGFWYGLFLTMTGISIGSLIAMSLGRLFGVQVVRRFVPVDLMAKLDQLIARGGVWNFFVIFILPVLPDDAVCFVAGVTRLSLWKLMLVMFLGRLPGMATLCFVGSSAGEGSDRGWIIFGVAMSVSFVAWLFSDELEAKVFGKQSSNVPGNSI